MNPTGKMLERFEGGQMNVKNSVHHQIGTGEIERIMFSRKIISIQLSWFAIAQSLSKNGWEMSTELMKSIDLRFYSTYKASSESGLIFSSYTFSEKVIFYPQNGGKIDPKLLELLEKTRTKHKNKQ